MQYYRLNDKGDIDCILCQHYCRLKEHKHGLCGININENNRLINTTYNHPSTVHLDPIEKKPLYHFLPSSKSLSIGTVGCNFRCPFCQNWSISQTSIIPTQNYLTPEEIVNIALKHGAKSISYTYNEPTIWYPYAKDIGILAKKAGLKNIVVSSGYESQEVLEDMVIWVDGANIDLKSFNASYYNKTLKTNLDGVLKTLQSLAQTSIWLEVTTLLIPNINDNDKELDAMATFMSTKVGKEVPWHFSAFHPDYKMQTTPHTPHATLEKAKKIAESKGIHYVYLGNIAGDHSTFCPYCNTKIVQRDGFTSTIIGIKEGKCIRCNKRIQGVWT
jgi:pyruvate formate lyase activating enzyme